MQIYIINKGSQTGPLSVEQVNRGLTEGTFEESDPAWHEGLPEWIQLKNLKGITLQPSSVPPKFDQDNFNAPPGSQETDSSLAKLADDLKELSDNDNGTPLVDRWCRFLFPGSKS